MSAPLVNLAMQKPAEYVFLYQPDGGQIVLQLTDDQIADIGAYPHKAAEMEDWLCARVLDAIDPEVIAREVASDVVDQIGLLHRKILEQAP
jgi:hypothetical protein